MDYAAALNRLMGLVDFERFVGPRGPRVKFDLRRMYAFLESLGDPHLGRPTAHITGTKGKGSTTAMMTSVLAAAGYRTGMFISPHLHTFRERISVDGRPVSGEDFASLVEEVWPHVEKVSNEGGVGEVTMFETLTAMAFVHFRNIKAGFQVMEVGMGGRLDSTNVVKPNVCIITSVSLDHTHILGDTVGLIAMEKAGIIKPGAPVVISPQKPEAREAIERVCREQWSRLIEVGKDITWSAVGHDLGGQDFVVKGRLGEYRLRTPLLGKYQMENASAVVGALEALREEGFAISDAAIREGMARVSWPCRMEVLGKSPLVVADGAHNPYSMGRLCESLPKYFNYRRVVVIFGASRDKNVEGMAAEVRAIKPIVVTARSRHPRGASPGELAAVFGRHGVEVVEGGETREALARARSLAGESDLILATGSLFLTAEVREEILGIAPEVYPQAKPRTAIR
ncbi:MAG: bifunctional folylpolyglutamate synthase/dihydrofolate synthase [SAR202 cluster bacterium]|nr:bifunctional folylpolyglutamate synthase/dihydrofolate synthase [SAR202 cluster bacterium]